MILDDIVAHKRTEVAQAQRLVNLDALREAARRRPPAADLALALSASGISVIAEIKRASPSKGPLSPDLDPERLAGQYLDAGAAAISVLTDRKFFQGSLKDLEAAGRACLARWDGDGSPAPVMRKDFVLSPYQVHEARAHGADAMLLIVRILDDRELFALLELARELGMEALVEVHSGEEIERAVSCGARIIGINNRDLCTFVTDISVTERLRPHVPAECIVVSESGIHTRTDVKRLEAAGVDAILVGETLVRSDDPGRMIAELVGR